MNTQTRTNRIQESLFQILERAPLLSVIIFAFAIILIQYLPRFIFTELSPFYQKYLGKIIISFITIVIISILGWWKETKFTAFFHWKSWLVCLPLFLLPVISAIFSDFYAESIVQVLIFLIYAFLVGFVEESVARGLFLRTLRPLGMWRSVLISSLLFEVMHFGNLLMGADLGKTVTQMIYATMIGLSFAGTLSASKTIWPLIIIHGLIDFFPKLDIPGTSDTSISLITAIIMIGITIPFAIYGLWRLHKQTTLIQGTSQ